jgi:hypothetical protein
MNEINFIDEISFMNEINFINSINIIDEINLTNEINFSSDICSLMALNSCCHGTSEWPSRSPGWRKTFGGLLRINQEDSRERSDQSQTHADDIQTSYCSLFLGLDLRRAAVKLGFQPSNT